MSDVGVVMGAILGAMGVGVFLLSLCLQRGGSGEWLPSVQQQAKRQFELWSLLYTAVWIGLFGCVVVFQMYERFTEHGYMACCVTLALPLLLQPLLFPLSAEKNLPLALRYSFKANVWIAIFSFIGNYWYTHYFYSVLKAQYLFPAHRLNDVPIALFFATHFYFVTYHTISNLILRKIENSFLPSVGRNFFTAYCILVFAYFTAFMETLSISSFPYYRFEDRFMAYTLGSAFYGIYFIVSYPVFFQLDEYVGKITGTKPHTLYQTVMEALGCSMLVLCLLDFCRLYLDVPLNISGVLYYIYRKN
jgi:cycloeucalenol cycloisomerase